MTCVGRSPGGTGRQEQNVRDSLWRGVGDRGSQCGWSCGVSQGGGGSGGRSRRQQSFLQEEGSGCDLQCQGGMKDGWLQCLE